MAFTAADVKTLREMTGVGMMDCKKALAASDGDMDKAVEFLREKGLAASAKKAGRIAAEGMAYAAVIDGVGVAVEVNAETDFVAIWKSVDLAIFDTLFIMQPSMRVSGTNPLKHILLRSDAFIYIGKCRCRKHAKTHCTRQQCGSNFLKSHSAFPPHS